MCLVSVVALVALGVAAALGRRRAAAAAASAWVLWSALGVAMAMVAPGVSIIFIFPALVGGAALLIGLVMWGGVLVGGATEGFGRALWLDEIFTVLIVDDNPANLDLLVRVLEGVPYELVAARSGELAVDLVPKVRPDLILMDVAMPGMGGVELTRRCAERNLRIPVIFVSAYAEPALADEGLRASRSHWLKKPFSSDDLLLTIRRLLDGVGGEGA